MYVGDTEWHTVQRLILGTSWSYTHCGASVLLLETTAQCVWPVSYKPTHFTAGGENDYQCMFLHWHEC